MIRDLWLLSILVIKSELWYTRNKAVYENKKPNWPLFYKRILYQIQDYSVRLKGAMKNCCEDMKILDYFCVRYRRVHFHEPVECFWAAPGDSELLLCCHRAARGNPGMAGAGVVARDSTCAVLGAISIGLGMTTNYLAEVCHYCWFGMGDKMGYKEGNNSD